MKSAIVIGAGLGGLASALRLGRHGFEVTLLEKQPHPGGRCNVIEQSGFRADTGPTILVMKETFEETYRALGLDIDERIQFVRLDPNYRIYFHDESFLDLYGDMARLSAEVEKIEPGSAERLFRFIGESAKKYELAMAFVERNYDHLTDLANPSAGLRLLQTHAYEQLYRQVGRFFYTDKLRKAFSFHSMFLGLSPFQALAMYSMITYADMVKGMYYPMGGIYRIVEDLVSLAEEAGVTLRTNAPVQEICLESRRGRGRVRGVRLESGEEIRADFVVSNADLPYTYRCLVDRRYRREYTDRRLDRLEYACSGYILFLGLDKTYPAMRHQALYFAQDYRANLDAIFRTYTLPVEISFHLNNPTITDPSLAPEGCSLLYVLAPMPNLKAAIDWRVAAPAVREQLIGQLERLVDPDIRRHIVWERDYRPTDWLRDINAVYGTAFGSLSHGFFQSSYFRPHNKADAVDGLYFVGQATYPGIGMPMVLISARLVTDRILQEQ
jgi:phytoene desaturase